jgi:hypothetical protein
MSRLCDSFITFSEGVLQRIFSGMGIHMWRVCQANWTGPKIDLSKERRADGGKAGKQRSARALAWRSEDRLGCSFLCYSPFGRRPSRGEKDEGLPDFVTGSAFMGTNLGRA